LENPKEVDKQGGTVALDSVISITGPVIYANMSDSKTNIYLSPRVVKDKANFLIYTNSKIFDDLQIKTVTNGLTYDVYRNFKDLYKALVTVGINLPSQNNLIKDIDILYVDDKKKEIAGFAVFQDEKGTCYLSKYDTSFQNEILYQLRSDGSCYSYFRVGKIPNKDRMVAFFLDS
jgi:hypothetical protein